MMNGLFFPYVNGRYVNPYAGENGPFNWKKEKKEVRKSERCHENKTS